MHFRVQAVMMACVLLVSTQVSSETLITDKRKNQALTDLQTLAADDMQGRKSGSDGHQKAATYIASRFASMGLKKFGDSYQQPFSYSQAFQDHDGSNVVGWVEGTAKPDYFIVITAHYDHLGHRGSRIFNGADDNASGVSIMLSLAQYLSTHAPNHSFLFVATDMEETGLYGSKAFLQNPPVAAQNMLLNLNLDMLGNGGRKDELYVLGSSQFNELTDWLKIIGEQSRSDDFRLRVGYKGSFHRTLSTGERVNWKQASDHASFARADIPFLYFGGDTHNQYHTPDDDFEHIDQGFFLGSLACMLQVVTQLDFALNEEPDFLRIDDRNVLEKIIEKAKTLYDEHIQW